MPPFRAEALLDRQATSRVISLWRRSKDAEGNPLHKPLTRERVLKEGEEPASCFVSFDGLTDSHDWHRDKQVTQRKAVANANDRAVLVQTREHVEELVSLFPPVAQTLRGDSAFGENLLIAGELTTRSLCVGDTLRFIREGLAHHECGDGPILQVSSPRWPCYKIDRKHSGPLGPEAKEKGEAVRGECVATGLAGFFCRVIREGYIRENDRVVVSLRPCPEIFLQRVAFLCYGGSNRVRCMLDDFQGSPQEMDMLLGLELLAEFEWKDRLRKLKEKMRKKAEERKRLAEEQRVREVQEKEWNVKRAKLGLLMSAVFAIVVSHYILFY